MIKRPERRKSEDRMAAIARGVAARLEEKLGYYRKITSETINIARALGVAEREITKWANERAEELVREESKLKEINARLKELGIFNN